MAIDLTAIINSAQKASAKSVSSGSTFPYRSVFVIPGNPNAKLNIKLLASSQPGGVVSEKYFLHKSLDNKHNIFCPWTESKQTCPVCAKVSELNNSKGLSLKGSNARSLIYAQYISSKGYQWNSDFPEPEAGSIILVMGPFGLYNGINNLITTMAEYPDRITKLLAMNQGYEIAISRDSNNRILINPTMGEYTSAASEDEFSKMISELKPLKQLLSEGYPDSEEGPKRQAYVDELTRRYQPELSQYQAPTNVDQEVANTGQAGFGNAPVQPQYTPPVQPTAPVQPQYIPPAQPTAPVQGGYTPPPQQPASVQQYAPAQQPVPTDALPESMSTDPVPPHLQQPAQAPVAPVEGQGGWGIPADQFEKPAQQSAPVVAPAPSEDAPVIPGAPAPTWGGSQ